MIKFNNLTQRINSFFQLDIKKVLGRASYLLSSQMVGNLLSFVIAITVSHFVSKDIYGTYRYVVSTVSFIGVFSLTGLSTAIVRSSARGFDYLYISSIKRSLLWSSPAILVSIGVGLWYFLHGNIVLGFSITLGGIIFPFIQALLLYRSYLNGKEYFKALMKGNIAYSVVTSLAILATLFWNPTVVYLVSAYYLSNLLITIIITIAVRKRFKPNTEVDPQSGKLEHHMSLMNILDIGATQLDKLLLFQIEGPIEVARYIFATIIPEQLRGVVKYTSTLSMPIFSALDKNIAKSKGIFLVKRLFLITIPLVAIYIVAAPFIYKIFFPAYLEVVGYSQVFALLLIFDGGIAGTILKAKNEVKKLYFVNITSNIVKIVLLIILGFTMGIWGIIISRIISRIISFSISYIALKKMV